MKRENGGYCRIVRNSHSHLWGCLREKCYLEEKGGRERWGQSGASTIIGFVGPKGNAGGGFRRLKGAEGYSHFHENRSDTCQTW